MKHPNASDIRGTFHVWQTQSIFTLFLWYDSSGSLIEKKKKHKWLELYGTAETRTLGICPQLPKVVGSLSLALLGI